MAAVGCSSANTEVTEGSVDTQSQAFSNDIVVADGPPTCRGAVCIALPTCTAARSAKINEAGTIALRYVSGDRAGYMKACLLDSFLAPPAGAWAEEIVARMGSVQSTTITCADFDDNASGSVGIATEALTINNAFVDGYSPARIASVLLHEIGHNKGYSHLGPLEYMYSANENIERCVLEDQGLPYPYGDSPLPAYIGAPLDAAPVRPSALSGPVELQRAGGTRGDDVLDYCTAGLLPNAQTIRLTPGGTMVQAVSLGCGTDSAAIGSAAGGTTASCPAGYVLSAVRGYASEGGVSQLSFGCTNAWGIIGYPLTDTPVSSWLPAQGPAATTGAHYFERVCPPGTGIVGLAGKQDSLGVEAISLICDNQTIAAEPTVSSVLSPATLRRAEKRSSVQNRCSGDTLLNGIFGFENATHIDRLGTQCSTRPLLPTLSYVGPGAGADPHDAGGSATTTFDPPLAIPSPVGVPLGRTATATLTVTDAPRTLGAVVFKIEMTHPDFSELVIKLTHGATTATVWPLSPANRRTTSVESHTGTSLQIATTAFSGALSAGDWTLIVEDRVPGNAGSVDSWTVSVDPLKPTTACASGSYLIGADTTMAADGVASFRGICVDYDAWRGTSRFVNEMRTTEVGAPVGNRSIFKCARGQFLKGMRLGGSANGLETVQYICEC